MSDSFKPPRDVASSQPWFEGGLIACQAAIYVGVAVFSRRFDYAGDFSQRPIVPVLLLLAAAFVLHLVSLRQALRSPHHAAVRRCVLWGATLFRAILLPSLPIQEIDLYRYLWDGAVVANGQNPYHFSPLQVLHCSQIATVSPDLDALIQLKDRSGAIRETLARVHYGELITAYPPVSQAVFGLAVFVVPESASLEQYVLTMKLALTLFDVATAWLLLLLLQHVGRHPGWAVLYAWSPLVLKEFANSGHLDSIAVFLSTAAVLCLLFGLAAQQVRSGFPWLAGSALLLGLGVGAKLYPLILMPVLVVWTVRRTAWRVGIAYLLIALLAGAGSLAPMIWTKAVPIDSPTPSPQGELLAKDRLAAGSGLSAFLLRWQINDFLFLVIVENLRPDPADEPTRWFVVVPLAIRSRLGAIAADVFRKPISQATFLAARIVSLLVFGAIVCAILRRAVQRDDQEFWLRTVFLTLAWFWTLSPTQNPWYWTWAMPFLPFAGRRAWRLVSLAVLAYYLRFWLLYQFPETSLARTVYPGEPFFHNVVAPLEHGLWMFWLVAESLFFGDVCGDSQKSSPRSA